MLHVRVSADDGVASPLEQSSVPAGEVRAQLARILESPSFLSAPILSRLLRHIVEHTLAGAADELKEYSLGVAVFDRGEAFDPRTDTIVRVQARRLRARLQDYYAAQRQSDAIQIEVPTGGYAAIFRRHAGDNASAGDPGARLEALESCGDPVVRRDPGSGRLPAPRTPLVGRAREIEDVTRLVKDPDVRLLTLSGAGGSGKTRLALETARALMNEFAGGVFMLPLAPLVDPTSVVTALGQMLGLRQTGGRAAADALREHVARSIAAPTLLLLDNFEHVLDAAPMVADLLDASAHVKLLVTSRAVLRVYGEHDYPVPPLALPHPAAVLEQLECNPAVRLFVQRAEAAHRAFALTADNAKCVAEICRRLDGLPLAIELAAAQARVLPIEGILARLERPLDFLTGGARERPARQQTLRNTIDWSHRLLSPAEQMLFRRLAVFTGGWTPEGAEAVCNAQRDVGIEVAAGIASLPTRASCSTSGGSPAKLGITCSRRCGNTRASRCVSRMKTRRRAVRTRRTASCWPRKAIPSSRPLNVSAG